MYFELSKPGQVAVNAELWVARRASLAEEFHVVEPVRNVKAFEVNYPKSLSSDSCTLYFVSRRADSTNWDLFRATKQ
jgi:hypothetical protein